MADVGRIFLSPPDVGAEEEKAVVRAVRSGWVAPVGPEVQGFEEEAAEFVNAGYAVALSSGTAALHLGLRAIGVGPGDAVITSSMTFVATANAIVYTGASPVFVDCLPDGTIDPELVLLAINAARRDGLRVAAIMPVDIYGRLAHYEEILPLAAEMEIPVITDSAEALGASRAGQSAGGIGKAAVVSFNGNKIMTTSGGGMLFSPDEEVVDYVRYLSTQARQPVVHFEHSELGYNYRMSNVCAAIGRAQLSRLPAMVTKRRKIRQAYLDVFDYVPGVSVLPGNLAEDNCWLTAIVVDEEVAGWSARELMAHLDHADIESRPLWKPMHLQPLYLGSPFFGGVVSEKLFRHGLALPSGSGMSDSQWARISATVMSFLATR